MVEQLQALQQAVLQEELESKRQRRKAQGRTVKELQAVEQGKMVQKKVQGSREVRLRKLDSPGYLHAGPSSTEEWKVPGNHILRLEEGEGGHYKQLEPRLQIA